MSGKGPLSLRERVRVRAIVPTVLRGNERAGLKITGLVLWLACWTLWAGRPALAGDEPAPRDRPRDRDRGRVGVPNGKNERGVKSAFQEVLSPASSATVLVRAGGQDVALGAVVDPGGYLVTKASVLEGKIMCRFKDGTEKDAKIVGEDERHDLALLRVDAANLTVVPWREGPPPPPGSFVATTAPADEPVALGVVSTGLRQIPAARGPRRPRGWLGIELGGGESGTGLVDVADHSPAAKAGLHVGDEIRKIDGNAVKSADEIVYRRRPRTPGHPPPARPSPGQGCGTLGHVGQTQARAIPARRMGRRTVQRAESRFPGGLAARYAPAAQGLRRSVGGYRRPRRGHQHRPGAAGHHLRPACRRRAAGGRPTAAEVAGSETLISPALCPLTTDN